VQDGSRFAARIVKKALFMEAVMKRLMVGIDGSPESAAATRKAMELAKAFGARLMLVHVSSPRSSDAAAYESAADGSDLMEHDYTAALLSQGFRDCRDAGVEAETSSAVGPVADALASMAEAEKMDLVVVGHRGRGAVTRALLGSVADRLTQICSRPVLVVR
jgi:nucleotide-binding universal stress UspA family protein